ncbi:DUF6525 family protein [Pseudooctadecabacter jejudonensis]|uniref:Uncharacterized protein n=1 Tax=Pseudooctadecabacter jejudonensis TaxID=1391910 RepID=A0A1Y5SS81_9RHOB|nr:DUF6525 family protein [Pseudooctadecabacter jejudonensis]SLN46560.1 hypothetical protein PSJ8397_02431 [Pseudooctadecabacter jejudonensis]
MPTNRGRTRLKSRASGDPMLGYDRLPAPLRLWMAHAKRPWSAKTVARSYDRALQRTGDAALALAELDALQDRLIAKDARFVWGPDYLEVANLR